MNCTTCIDYFLCDAAYTAIWNPLIAKNDYKDIPKGLRVMMIAMDTNNGCDSYAYRGGDINE